MTRLLRGLLALALIPICGLAIGYLTTGPKNDQPVEPMESTKTFFANGLAMGSTYQVKAVVPESLFPVDGLDTDIVKFLKAFNKKFSTYDPESEVSKFNASPSTDWIDVSAEIAELTSISLELSAKTKGSFDITVGPLVDLWSFGPDRRPRKVPTDEEIAKARESVGYQKLEVRLDPPALRKSVSGLRIDFNSIAPGYAADLMSKLLEERKLENYLIDVGGEIKIQGEKKPGSFWTIAIEKPSDDGSSHIQRVMKVKDICVATSGDYRNYFEAEGVRYSHTIDPATARPIDHRLTSVTVLTEGCGVADGTATALMVMGPDRGYDWAIDTGLAVYMIVKTNAGFEERITPRFTELTQDK